MKLSAVVCSRQRSHEIVTNMALVQDFGFVFVTPEKCIVDDICDGGLSCLEGERKGGGVFFTSPRRVVRGPHTRVGKVCLTFLPKGIA